MLRRVQNKNFPPVLQQLLREICNAKIVNTSCVNIRRSYYFSSEEVLQGLSKNNPTKNQVDAESQAILKHAPGRKRTEEFPINFAIWIVFYYSYWNPEVPVQF